MQYIQHRGSAVPLVGIGTYRLGEDCRMREREAEAFSLGVESYGMTLIDTAEMYGNGVSEAFVGSMIKSCDRSKLFIVDKILPHNAQKGLYYESCSRSLELLGTDRIDLYLLHWRSGVQLQDMVDNMQSLVQKGLIKRWGVSNFDTDDMRELLECDGGSSCFCDQILYNLKTRGPEFDLIPYCKRNSVLVMAYSPLCQSAYDRKLVTDDKIVAQVAQREGKSPESLMLSFVIRNKDIITVFKTSSAEHLANNMKNVFEPISAEDMKLLSQRFSDPFRKTPLETI